MQFFPASGRVNSTIWMHHIDADWAYWEKARRELHKNSTSYIEQILEATSHKTTTARPPTSYLLSHPNKTVRHCWRSKDELISDVLSLTPSHRYASAGLPAKTFLQLVCTDTGCSLEGLPETMVDKDEWRERERERESTWWWWWYNIII